MKAILLARVSSVDQEDTHSIPAQVERVTNYAERKGLDVLQIFKLTEKSTTDNRKKFNQIIDLIDKSKEPIALVVETIDRLQRGFKESVTLDERVKSGKLQIHFLRENLIVHKDSNSSEIMRWDIGVFTAKTFLLQMKDNVSRSVKIKLKNKEYPREAPLGYLNYRNAEDKSCIVLDPERSHHVKHLLELYASGNNSMITLAKEAEKIGLRSKKGNKISVSVIEHMLKNPFYYGYMKWGKFFGPHKYETLITKETYDQIQAVRTGWHKKKFKYAAIPFAFRGIIQCQTCKSILTPQLKKKKYTYYNCGKRDCQQHSIYIKETDLLKEIEKVFKKLSKLPQKIVDELVLSLKAACQASSIYHINTLRSLQTEYEKLEKRKSQAYDDKLDGSITADFYDKKFKEYTERQADLQHKMQQHQGANNQTYITASLVLDLAKRAYSIFQSSETSEKRQLINHVFQNCYHDGEKLVYELKEPFNIILAHANLPIWQGLLDALRTIQWTKIQQEIELLQKSLPSLQLISQHT